jgi:hypothetical protein
VAPVSPPSWLQAGSYSARSDRLTLAGLIFPDHFSGTLKPRWGVRPSPSLSDLKVTQRSTPDRWVSISAGICYVNATSATGGVYICTNDASYDVQTSASHATLARKDIIIARVYDAIDDTGSQNQFTIEVVTGTPAASPSRPAAPSQSTILAELLIPAASTTVTNANITDLRIQTVALGGVLPVADSSAVPLTPYSGMKIYRIDLKTELIWDGTAWQAIPYGGWSSYTPSWTAATTNPSLGNGSATGRVMQIGKMVHFAAHIVAGSTTTYGSGQYRISLPVNARTGNPQQLVQTRLWDNSASQAYAGQSVLSSTYVSLSTQGVNADSDNVTPTVPFTFANGDELIACGAYEAA